MRHFQTISIFIFYCLLIAPQNTWAKDHIRFCANDWPPYAYRNKNDNPVGISIDIARKAATNMGYRAEFVMLPWKRCLQEVIEGRSDAVLDAAFRKDFLQGPTSIAFYTNTIWVHRDSPFYKAEPLSQFAGLTIGFVDGYIYGEEFTSIERLRFDYSTSENTMIKKLVNKRVDFILGDLVSLIHIQKEQNLPIRALNPTPSADRLYTSFHNKLNDLQKDFDQELKVLLENGFVDRIFEKHIGRRYGEIFGALHDVLR